MLRGVIICPDREIREQIEWALSEISGLTLIRTIDRYQNSVELARFVRAQSPDIVFLSLESVTQALATQTQLDSIAPGIQVIAIHRTCEPALLLEVMRAGIREFVAPPFERPVLVESLNRLQEALLKRPIASGATDLLYSFLPSKAGAGTSTIALNTAIALSNIGGTRAFLGDFDLNSGMVRFMLKLDNVHSVIDAFERSMDIDENFWPQLVTSKGSLDVLHAGKLNPNFRLEAGQMRNLLDFVRRNYQVILADLSGNLEKYSIELMHESKRIFLVCTPEIPSLHLAREKYQYLQSLGLGDRVSILLNRNQKRSVISPAQIEELLGLPIQMTFPNDYLSVHRAVADGKHVNSSSELGKQCTALAHSMLESKAGPEKEPKKRFIEFFSVSPSRYSLEDRKSNA